MASTNTSSQNANQTASGQTSTSPTSGGARTPARRKGIRGRLLDGNRLHKVLIVLLAMGCVTLYVWHLVEMNQVETRVEAEMTALRASQSEAFTEQTVRSMRLTGHALGWAAASDLAAGNMTAIEAQLTPMIKVKPVTLIAVVDQDGIVRVATNQKIEGQAASTAFAGLPLTAEEVTVIERENDLAVVAPLVQDENRLGTAVLLYARPADQGEPPAEAAN